MTLRWGLRMAAAAAALLALGADPADAPAGALETVDASLSRASVVVLGEGSRNQKLVKLYGVTRELLDTRAMGRETLGDTLAAQPPGQQAEFLDLFDELVVRAYLRKLLFFRKPEFVLQGEQVRGASAVVDTVIRTKKDDYSVEYVLRRRDERWEAIDIVVEGVSLTGNYRAQFRGLLEHQSFEELLVRMRRKLGRRIPADAA